MNLQQKHAFKPVLSYAPVVFFNNEMHEMTRKKFMARSIHESSHGNFHEFFSCPFVFFVVKRIPDVLLSEAAQAG